MLKRDSIWLGVILGLALPGLVLFILLGVGSFIEPGQYYSRPFEGYMPLLISLTANLILIRIYFVRLKLDLTGRGILLATFVLGVLFFILTKYL